MEEIKDLHEISLEWGCICNLIDKIGDIEAKIEGGWDELINMIADIIDESGREKDPAKIFFDVYQFIFHLYYRLRTNPEKREFNQISKAVVSGKEVYRFTNYNYKNFKWAKDNGFIAGISNDIIEVPADKLTTDQRRNFDRRIGG